MSPEGKNKTELFISLVIAFLAVGTALQGFFILPYRVTQSELAIAQVKTERQIDHDLLLEIRGDVKALRSLNAEARR